MNLAVLRTAMARWMTIAVLVVFGAMVSAPAKAQTSTLCPTLNATVAYGGTVSIDATACHVGFGLGDVATPPTHGSATIGPFGPQQFINYQHNGSSGTTDTFVVRDGNAPPTNLIQVSITILPPTSSIAISPASLAPMTAGAPFSQTLSSTGGVGSYTYSLSSGSLPTGLTLSSAGVISGTPTLRGTYTFSVRSQDSVGDFVVKGYTGTVANPTLVINPASATAAQNAPFSLNIGVNGGVAPYSFLHEVVAGPLPAGMSLSSTGVLSGTPTTIGTTNFRMRVSDSSTGPGTYFQLQDFSFTVVAQPAVSIAVSPSSVSEDGATNLIYTVTRSVASSSPLTVNLATSGTAIAGTDYSGSVASVTIAANATTATVVIDPTADSLIEADKTVILSVAAGAGYTIGAPASATGTILNDDLPSASITVSPASVVENDGPNLVYTVALSAAAAAPLTIN